MSTRHDQRPIETPSSPSERASSAVTVVVSAFAWAGALGVIGSALYWMATSAIGLFERGSWLALALLGVAFVFAIAWLLRSPVLGRLWLCTAFVLAVVFLAPFFARVLW